MPKDTKKVAVGMPGNEWKTRDVSTPIECIRVMYEVERAYPGQPDYVLSAFVEIFRKPQPFIYEALLNMAGSPGQNEVKSSRDITAKREGRIRMAKLQLESAQKELKVFEGLLAKLRASDIEASVDEMLQPDFASSNDPVTQTTTTLAPTTSLTGATTPTQSSPAQAGGITQGTTTSTTTSSTTSASSTGSTGTTSTTTVGAQGMSTTGTTSHGLVTPVALPFQTPLRVRFEQGQASPASFVQPSPAGFRSPLRESIASKMNKVDGEIERVMARIDNINDAIVEIEAEDPIQASAAGYGGRSWKECLTKLILAAIRTENKETGTWALKNMLMKDIREYQKPAAQSEMQMAVELDHRRKFICWVFALFLGHHEMKDKQKEVGLIAYERFLQLQSNVGKSRFYLIRPDRDDPLQEAITILQAHLSMNVQDFSAPTVHDFTPAMPAIRSVKEARKPAPEAEDDDADEQKPMPSKKHKKALVAAQGDDHSEEPSETSVLVAAMQRMTDTFERRMNRLEKDVRAQGYPASENRERRYDEGKRWDRRDDTRRYEHGKPSPRSDGSSPRICLFSPCVRPDCRSSHKEGQWKPDGAAWNRREEFRKAGRCIINHDRGSCARRCNRTHGKHANESQALCPHVGKSMCQDFFSAGGCSKSHRQ